MMAGNKIDKSPERERFDLWLFWIWVLLGFVLSVLIFVKRWFTAVVFRNGDWAREVNFGGAFLLFGFLAFLWMKSINKIVPDPYLDEVFHVPQAQRYCHGKWAEWDDKITTPPGLYILSAIQIRVVDMCVKFLDVAVNRVVQSQKSLASVDLCEDTSIIRETSVWSILAISIMAAICRRLIEYISTWNIIGNRLSHKNPTVVISNYSVHTGINVALMPVLFFFGGLYYTDVASTLTVLLTFWIHLKRLTESRSSNDVALLFFGLLSLNMRQTNIFWVVVYMGGRELISAVRKHRVGQVLVDSSRIYSSMAGLTGHFWQRYAAADVNDPTLDRMTPDDVFFTAISYVIATAYLIVKKPLSLLKDIWPYAVIMGAFTVFVIWNGGVVLGDKSNHVATIHLAQMLYIWPFFLFFSWPLMIPVLFSIAAKVQGFFGYAKDLPRAAIDKDPAKSSAKEEKQESATVKASRVIIQRRLYLLPVPFLVVVGSLMVIKHNTIVHPFTLADNRHYMFYVARYTIRKSLGFRYQLFWIYLGSAILTLGSLSPTLKKIKNQHARFKRQSGYVFMNRPFPDPTTVEEDPIGSTKLSPVDFSTTPSTKAFAWANLEEDESPKQTTHLSTIMLWCLATALSLITGPLVEPRYFIVPWLLWRLETPAWTETEHLSFLRSVPLLNKLPKLGKKRDIRLYLETIWFILVNLVVCTIFLLKPYQWRAEDGTLLDEGRLQRFMW